MLTSRLNSIPRFALPYTHADFIAGALAILRGGPLPEAFGLLGASPKFWTRSGRQALRLLLEALDLTPGSGVALPLFTDPSLVGAILAAGHRPVFIDIDQRTFTMDPKSLDAARGAFAAVVVVHLFGQMADLPALRAVAGDIPLIEDAAHAPLSFLDGRLAGGFGAASFYSFASTKYWPAGGGGLAVVNDLELVHKDGRGDSVPSTTFLRGRVAPSCSSGGQGDGLYPPALWDLRKADATMGRGLGASGTPLGSAGDRAIVRRRRIPTGAALSAESGSAASQQPAAPRDSAPWKTWFFPSNGPELAITIICSPCCSWIARNARR